MLEVIGYNLRINIISSIPEILEDSQHIKIAKYLIDLLDESSDLTLCILDALVNLNLPKSIMVAVNERIIDCLSSINMKDLPIIIKFLLENINNDDNYEKVYENINRIRMNVGFENSLNNNNNDNRDRNETRDCKMLILENIKSSLIFKKSICNSWIKCINDSCLVNDFYIIDVFVLIKLIQVGGTRKKNAFSAIKAKVKQNLLTYSYLCDNIFNLEFFPIIKNSFTTLLDICIELLGCSQIYLREFAQNCYQLCFLRMDMNDKQQVISTLVTHIGMYIMYKFLTILNHNQDRSNNNNHNYNYKYTRIHYIRSNCSI